MRSALIEFDRSIRDLRNQLTRHRLEEELLALSATSDPPSYSELVRSLREAVEPFAFKQSNYSTAVVLLYGALERFVDSLVVAATDEMSRATPRFELLSAELQESHRRRTIEAMADEPWILRAGTTVPWLAEGLFLCESGSDSYRLNSNVFARHRQNYRRESLAATLRDIGCTDLLSRLASSERIRSATTTLTGVSSVDDLLGWIDEVASRRNDVAHGSPSDLLSTDQLDERAIAIWHVGVSIFELVVEDLSLLFRSHIATRLGTVGKVHYKHVGLFDLSDFKPGAAIRVGDPAVLAAKRLSSERCRWGRITSIQIDDSSVEEVRAADGVGAGVGFSFRLVEGGQVSIGSTAGVLGWLADDLPVQEPA